MQQTREAALPTLLSAREVAAALRVSPDSVYRWARAGELASVRVSTRPGSALRIPATELERILRPLGREGGA
jgi:excisionase family DNA binding protein